MKNVCSHVKERRDDPYARYCSAKSPEEGSVATGAVVDAQVDPDLVRHSLGYDFCRILDHLQIRHARDHFVKREGFDIGFLIAHPEGIDHPNDCLISRVEKLPPHLGKLLPQWQQPSP
jgi:hypothetical protein